jgi:hypothetical protein
VQAGSNTLECRAKPQAEELLATTTPRALLSAASLADDELTLAVAHMAALLQDASIGLKGYCAVATDTFRGPTVCAWGAGLKKDVRNLENIEAYLERHSDREEHTTPIDDFYSRSRTLLFVTGDVLASSGCPSFNLPTQSP